MKKINILFVSHEPLTAHLKKMYCIDDLKKEFKVEFLSLRTILYGNKTDFFKFENELVGEFIDFTSIYRFYVYLKNYSKENTYIFLESSDNHFSSIIINLLIKKYRICRFHLYGSFQSSSLLIIKRNFFEKIFFYCKNLKFLKKTIIRKLINFNYELIFYTGNKNNFQKNINIIHLNSSVVHKNDLETIEKNYTVFIDQGYPTHPDLLKKGYVNNEISSFIKDYNDFFSEIEKKFKTKIKIAKHPKSTIPNSLFGEREVVKGNSEELIKNSKYVIAHNSLINNIAIINYKPIILIYSSEFENFPNTVYIQIKSLAKTLGVDCINIESYDINKIKFSLTKEYYDNYINKYIKVDSRENHQIIKEEIIKNYNIK